MAPPPAMQRKTIRRAVIAIAILTVATLSVARLSMLPGVLGLGLAAGNERRQPVDIALTFLRHVLLRPRLKVLRLRLKVLRLRLMLLRLKMLRLLLLFARVKRLTLRRIGLAGLGLFVAVVVAVVGAAATRLLLIIRLALAQLFLCGGDQTEIMFGVLVIIFRRDRISGALRVAGKLEIFFRDVRGRATNFDVLAVRFVHPRERILVMMTTFAIATAHPFILTVSHDSLFRQPLLCNGRTAAASLLTVCRHLKFNPNTTAPTPLPQHHCPKARLPPRRGPPV